ncbi:hypothetical protein SAVIM338S_00910 [Streptomyces avidinii]
MCHRADSSAPAPPVSGPITVSGALTVRSADGAEFRAFHAVSVGGGRGNVVILPDVRGLHPFYEDLARRFAEAGYNTAAIDLYGRTAANARRGDDFAWREHTPEVQDHQVDADVAAAAAVLHAYRPGPLFTVGFCFGGGHSWRLAGSTAGLAGAVGFYGLPHLVTGPLHRGRAPSLLLLAEEDDETAPSAYAELTARLDAGGAPYERCTYAGAPHSFFDRTSDNWAEACADAWQRVLEFTDQHGSRS